jgi:catechol 2,3-dioxygenase
MLIKYLKGAIIIMKFHQIPHTFVGQVNLKVENFQQSLTFYQNLIGFQILEQSERKAVLTADGKTPLLSIEQPENVIPKQPRTTGLYHFALLLPNRSDLAKVLEHLVQNSYPLQGASDHLVSEALYLADPDGNGIEIYIDRPSSTWNWNNGEVAMVSDPLDVQNLLGQRDGGTWKGLPAETLMGHIHLHVSELKQTEEFYCKGLGFELVNRYGNQALFISTGGYHHHIGLNTWNGNGAPKASENSVGLSSYSLVLPSEEARKNTVEQLKRIGVAVKEESGVIVTHDPSGNKILLLVS